MKDLEKICKQNTMDQYKKYKKAFINWPTSLPQTIQLKKDK